MSDGAPAAARRILIVDDEPDVAGELESRLAGLGYQDVTIASSAVEAIAMTARTAPDLVLMEMALRGDMNTVRAAKEIQRHGAIPVVFMIAESDGVSPRQAGVTSPYGSIIKPFTDEELRANIELALSKQDVAKAVHDVEDRFFAASIDMLCFLDFSGYFKRLNPAWERTLGFTRTELMSRPFIEFVHPDDRERTLKQNLEVRTGGQAVAFENRYLCKDGSYRWFRWNAAPDSAEQLIYSVARDVTESKKAEDEREQLVRELQTALAEVRALRETVPICSYCGKERE